MTLMDEVNALRKELENVQRKQSKKAAEAAAPAEAGDAEREEGFAALLHAVEGVIDDFGQEVDKFPRITALTALTVGLAFGFVIGRHSR